MNSRQRRRERRRFQFSVPVIPKNENGWWMGPIGDMDLWCRRRFGMDRYRCYIRKNIIFAFETEADMMEFKVMWA